MSERVRVACVQVTATPDMAANIDNACRRIDEAAAAGARLVLLPENAALMAGGKIIAAQAAAEAAHPALAAFAFTLPDRLKVRRGIGKWLLRRWLATGLPEAKAFSRKRGFTVPVGEWIAAKGRKLGPLVAVQPGVAEVCKPDAVDKLFAAVDASGKLGKAAWTLLFYALWHRRHILALTPGGDVFDTLAAA